VGGSAWEIYSILEDLFQYPLETIVAKIKRERLATIVDVIRNNRALEGVLQRFVDEPVHHGRALLACDTALLGALVAENILFYDPVDGVYGIQGKSLEWGLRAYFD